jgi:hypothetical protein
VQNKAKQIDIYVFHWLMLEEIMRLKFDVSVFAVLCPVLDMFDDFF